MSEQPSDGLPPEVFQELLAKYRKAIPERLKAIDDAIALLRQNPTKEPLVAVRFLVHKMAGNAGTFGYYEVTRVCREWEHRLSGMIDQFPNCTLDAKLFGELEAFSKTIRKEFGVYGG